MADQRPTIFVTRRLPPAVTERLVETYDARLNEDDHPLSDAELKAGLADADGVITASSTSWDEARFASLPERVKIVTTFSVGFEHIDLDAAKARGVRVGNTPEVLTEAVADIAMLCLLGAARRGWEAQSMLREGRWKGWHTTQLVGMELAGKKLGIVGMGRIGRATARRAKGFGIEVHYHNRRPLGAGEDEGATFHANLETLLPAVDIVSLSCPATPETMRMVDAAFLAKMRPGSILVNTARGALVDEAALMAALDSGHLFAAGLDVFDNEPNVDPKLVRYENIYALPHIGSATVDTRNAMGFCCLDNLDAFFTGKPLPFGLV
ncbi:MAG: D-glycerate dehydrogenase [Geminicoccaceae bacterium]|nr:MAG: D-glycerate dehydrogenase [Geminicoccaceae bacterium]